LQGWFALLIGNYALITKLAELADCFTLQISIKETHVSSSLFIT